MLLHAYNLDLNPDTWALTQNYFIFCYQGPMRNESRIVIKSPKYVPNLDSDPS
jgi:hypothetical protein